MMMRKSIKYLTVFFCSILTAMAFVLDKTYLPREGFENNFGGYLVQKLNGNNFMYFFILVASCVLYAKCFEYFIRVREHIMPLIVSILLGGILMIGDGFYANERLTFMVDNIYQFLVCLGIFLGYVALLYIGLCWIDGFYEIYYRDHLSRRKRKINRKKLYLLLFFVLLICWTPYLFSFFPGSVPMDGMVQIAQAMDVYVLKNDHPVLSTLFLGLFTKFGRLINNDYIGIFSEILAQTLFVASAFAFLLYRVFMYSKNKVVLLISTLVLGVYPTWGLLVEAFIKDAFYVGFFTYFVVFFADFLIRPAWFTKKIWNIAGLILSMLGVCFWRNNGFHVLFATFFLMLFAKITWREKAKVSACFIGVFVCYFAVLNVLYPMMGLPEEKNAPEMNAMLQQTARYLTRHPKEVTQEEKDAISGVADFDYLSQNYHPNNSDYAKKTYNIHAPEQAQTAYRKAWFEMLKKHPVTYIEATLNTTYDYYYFGNNERYMSEYQNYTKYEANFCLPGLKEIQWLSVCRKTMNSWAELVRALPGINLLGRCGFYTWILIIISALLLKRRQWNHFIALAPLWFNTLLFCLVSPINGLQRYDWPVMAAIPICFGIALTRHSTVQKKEKGIADKEAAGSTNE